MATTSIYWPDSLPQSPLLEGLAISNVPNSIEFQPEVGQSKGRRRYTGKRRSIPMALPPITSEQLAVFNIFFDDDLSDGNLTFLWKDFETGAPDVEYVFDSQTPVQKVPIGNGKWSLNFVLYRLY